MIASIYLMHGLAVFNPHRFSLTLRRSRPPTAAAELRALDKRIFMKNIIAVFLLSELKGGSDGVNLAFEYTDGSALPKLGEFVYFGSPEVKFQISAREHLFQDDETVRIIYRLTRPQRVNESEAACLRAQLIQLEDM